MSINNKMSDMDSPDGFFNYVYSCSLNEKLRIKIGTLEGLKFKPNPAEILENPMSEYSGMSQKQQCADLVAVCQVHDSGKPLCSPVWTSYKSFSHRMSWSEWLTMPIMYSDLTRKAVLTITIQDCNGPSSVTPIGGTTIKLFGKYNVFREGMMDVKVWPNVEADPSDNSSTPAKTKSHSDAKMPRLAKLAKKHRNGQIPVIDWIDRLTFRDIEMINEDEKKKSDHLYLMLEFPQPKINDILYSIVWFEHDGDAVFQFHGHPDIIVYHDTEILKDNLVESKHHKLFRSLRSGSSDKDIKPNSETRNILNSIVEYPPNQQLTVEEQDMVWKFRFYLSNEKRALTPFLKCVNWSTSDEVNQALQMLFLWRPMDIEDALQLLCPNFTHPVVRRYAVSRLQTASDDDLLLYLLQLVQALKYENYHNITDAYNKSQIKATEESTYSCTDNKTESSVHDKGTDLVSFLIDRASKNNTLANYFHWYLLTECDDFDGGKQDNKAHNMYQKVKTMFLQTLENGSPELQLRHRLLIRQKDFMEKLKDLMKTVLRESGNRKKKTERLQALLADPDAFKINFTNFEPIPLPLDPDIMITGIVPEKALLFKSALMPAKLTFLTTDGKEYVAIFKIGDDLRQDQLILQMITLIDKLLRLNYIDMKLTPYRVLSTSTKHGLLQYIDSYPVAEVLATEGTIQNFFRKHHSNSAGPYGISPEIMENYIRSVSGYCVITYLLGVGDRHLDNLLLTTTGRLFHIDFGYILGRDPKPLPPPMKLSKEMVEAMGGVNSDIYHEFKRITYLTFLNIRRSTNLILNLFALMVDASVPDIALEPDKAVQKVLDKFIIHANDEEAIQWVHGLIDESVAAVMAALVEQFHKVAQYWRK